MESYLLVFLLFLSAASFTQEDKYTGTMQKKLVLMDSARSVEDYLKLANTFERIADAEKSKWVPNYYSALCLVLSSFMDSSNAKKDSYLDKADMLLSKADSLQPNNSEIYTLKGFSAMARMVVSPFERWQQYGQLYNSLLQKAKELDPNNPRPEYLIGQATLNTPEQFGGGKDAALPILKASLDKYNKFIPETPISPNWGKQQVEEMLKRIEPADSTGNIK
jgi:hypothetical protein